MDVSCDGLVDWEDFCTYTLLQYQELDYERHNRETPFIGKPKFFSDPRMNKVIISLTMNLDTLDAITFHTYFIFDKKRPQ